MVKDTQGNFSEKPTEKGRRPITSGAPVNQKLVAR